MSLFPHRLGGGVAFQEKYRPDLANASITRSKRHFPCLSFGQGRWGSELHKRGKGRRLDDPSKRLSKTAFDAQNKRFPQTKAFPCEGRGTAIAVDE